MEINGFSRTCGLIGAPVEHTQSPTIHNGLAQEMGINLVYVPFLVKEDVVPPETLTEEDAASALQKAVQGAYALNVLGLNVTVPYKSAVIPFLKAMDPLAAQIGAVNTLVRTEGGFKGYNTDMPGLLRALAADGVKVQGEKVIILGAGGVARAVAMLLAKNGAAEILLLNRTLERAQQIVEEVEAILQADETKAQTQGTARSAAAAQEGARDAALAQDTAGTAVQNTAALPLLRAATLDSYQDIDVSDGKKYLCIQATNVGMYPHVQDAVIADAAFYEKIHTGYDLIFNPAKTRFMQLCEAGGAKAYNGLKMLLYQGVIAFELWTNSAVSEEALGPIYAKMQENLQA